MSNYLTQEKIPEKTIFEKTFLKHPNFKQHELMENGNFGRVYQVKDENGEDVAAKVLIKVEKKCQSYITSEIKMLSTSSMVESLSF